jgi:hypothetical protein
MIFPTVTATTTFAEGVLQISAQYWKTMPRDAKIAYVEGMIGGIHGITFILRTGNVINAGEEDSLVPADTLDIEDVVRVVDEFYAKGPRYESVPMYAVVYEKIRKVYKSYK